MTDEVILRLIDAIERQNELAQENINSTKRNNDLWAEHLQIQVSNNQRDQAHLDLRNKEYDQRAENMRLVAYVDARDKKIEDFARIISIKDAAINALNQELKLSRMAVEILEKELNHQQNQLRAYKIAVEHQTIRVIKVSDDEPSDKA